MIEQTKGCRDSGECGRADTLLSVDLVMLGLICFVCKIYNRIIRERETEIEREMERETGIICRK